MTSPIKPNANATGGSAQLNDLMGRLRGQGADAASQSASQAFSQWMDKHVAAQDKPASSSSALSANQVPARSAIHPAQPQAMQQPSRAMNPAMKPALNHATVKAAVPHAPEAAKAAAPAKTAPEQSTAKADARAAKPAAKDGSSKTTSGASGEADTASPDRSEATADASATPVSAAVVRELTPPSAIQPGDAAGMMAWLASLSQSGEAPGQGAAAGGEADATLAGNAALSEAGKAQAGKPGLEDATRAVQGLGGSDASSAAGVSLDNPAWRSASGAAALQADAMLAPAGTSPDKKVDADALSAMLSGGIKEVGWSQARPEAATLRHDTATLAAPFGSTDFAQALAEKVSMWVSTARTEGPMTAELHLNPADMGPINVKISLDGQSAHVDFAAAALETRQAIEASLPMLSSALDSVGLSLSGGDVSSQTSQQAFEQALAQGDAQRGLGGSGRSGREGEPMPAEGALRSVSVPRAGRPGGLDLYA